MTYKVTLKSKSDFYAVPVVDVPLMADKKYRDLQKLVIYDPDLPPGKVFDTQMRTLVLDSGQTVTMAWKVRRASKEDGTWRVLDAAPLPMGRNLFYEFELCKQAAPGASVTLIRSGDQIQDAETGQKERQREFVNRIAEIKQAVESKRAELVAALPGKPVRSDAKFGGSGSGEPTKTAARTGGGAAVGAGIGALAGGDGESAGWGALGGAVAGFIYDQVSKSNDRKKFEAALANKNVRTRTVTNPHYTNQKFTIYNAKDLGITHDPNERLTLTLPPEC